MTRALVWSESFDLEERLAVAREQLAEVGWEALEPEWIFAACKVAVGMSAAQVDPREIGERLVEKPALIEDATEGLKRVATWLAAHCGIASPRIVPYRLQVVMLSEILRSKPALDATTSSRMARWFWRTTYGEPLTDANADRMLQELHEASTNEVDQEPLLDVPAGFNPASVRVKAIALRLAAQRPRDLDGSLVDATQQLADHGVSALLPLSPSLRGCAGRLFLRQGSKLREALLDDATAVPVEVLQSHAITQEAARALGEKDYSKFIELRGAEIRRLEEAFYRSTQEIV